MEDDTRRLLDLLAEALQTASLLCGKIIGNDDFANEPITRKSPFRIVSEGGKPSKYPKVKFQLLTEKRAEEVAVAVYLPYGTGSIRKRTRENKNSRYSWWEGRFRHRTVTAKTKQEAYDKLKELARTEVSEGKTDKKEVSSSLYEWVEYWYITYKERELRPNSKIGYNSAFTKIKTITIPMKDLKPDDLQQFLNSIDGDNARRKTFDILNQALRQAVISEKIKKNPCELLKRPKVNSEHKRAFTAEQQVAILNACSDKYRRLFSCLCCTGMRISEFLALTPDDIGDDEIRVNKMMNRDGMVEHDTKNRSSERFINFNESLREDLLFCINEHFTYNAVKLAFGKIFKKLGLEGVSVHSTRHTFASMCHLANINELLTKKWLGHATLAMTKDVYTHFLKRENSPFSAYFAQLKDFER